MCFPHIIIPHPFTAPEYQYLLVTPYERNSMLWVYLKRAPSPFACQKHEGIFSNPHCENLTGVLRVKLTKCVLPETAPPRALTLGLVYPEPPATHQLQFRFSYPSTGSHESFCSRNLWFYQVIGLSHLRGSIFLCDLNSLMNLRVGNFHFVSFFFLCEDESYNFQALYALEWKPKVFIGILKKKLRPEYLRGNLGRGFFVFQ